MIIMTVLGCSGIVYITVTVSKYMKIALAEETTASLVYGEDSSAPEGETPEEANLRLGAEASILNDNEVRQ